MFSSVLKNNLKKLGLKKGDKILVSSDVLKFLVYLKKNKINYNLNDLINDLIKTVGKDGNIIFPTFNWDFCKGITFDNKKSKSMTGALSNTALKRHDFIRSHNPIYSFAIWGKNKKKISELNHKSCFDLSSPFGYLIKNNAKNLFIGIDYKDGLTFVHVAEEQVRVKYRYFKYYEGNVINNNKIEKKNYRMYVRDLSKNLVTTINKKMDKILKKKGKIKKNSFFGVKFSLINIKSAYNIMVNDLKKEKKIVQIKKPNL